MLKVHLDLSTDTADIDFHGNIMDALSAISYVVKDMYDHFCAEDASAGELFKTGFQMLIVDELSPVWQRGSGQADGIKKVEIRLPNCMRPDSEL